MDQTKDKLKHIIGWVAERVWPELAKELDEERNSRHAPTLKRCIIHARLKHAVKQGDHDAVQQELSKFWKNNMCDKFYSKWVDDRYEFFLQREYPVIEALRDCLIQDEGGFYRLVEIGCGDGRVLSHCFERLPNISSAVGLDLNGHVLETTAEQHTSIEGLSFCVADGAAWLEANPAPGTVLLFNNGVLEYLTSKNFDAILRTLAAYPPALIALIEPVAPDHDMETETETKVYGRENSFSHNHRYRLIQAGFEVLYSSELYVANTRLVLMLGSYKGAQSAAMVAQSVATG